MLHISSVNYCASQACVNAVVLVPHGTVLREDFYNPEGIDLGAPPRDERELILAACHFYSYFRSYNFKSFDKIREVPGLDQLCHKLFRKME